MNEIRTGNYLAVLQDVQADVMITDPPYSPRCHEGQFPGRGDIEYSSWGRRDYEDLLTWAEGHVAGWWVILTDHVSWWAIDQHIDGIEHRYAFAPVPVIIPGMTCRLSGDGPSSWAIYAHVSRPMDRAWSRWRTLPGAYRVAQEDGEILGQKPFALMLNLVRDYSNPGMAIVDPCAGMGTTLRAAQMLNRSWVGSEVNSERANKAKARMADVFTADLF